MTMETKEIKLGAKTALGIRIELPGAPPLILIKGERGALFCGYLSLEAAEKFELAAAIVSGVGGIDEILMKGVSALTRKAAIMGVKEGMTGKDALKILA